MPTNKGNLGRAARNTRTTGSAASFAGCIGLPDTSGRLMLHDGGLLTFCRTFNQRFDDMAATTRPEWRSFSRAERETRAAS